MLVEVQHCVADCLTIEKCLNDCDTVCLSRLENTALQ